MNISFCKSWYKMPTGGRCTRLVFILGVAWDLNMRLPRCKYISTGIDQNWGLELGTSGLQVQHPDHQAMLPVLMSLISDLDQKFRIQYLISLTVIALL